MIENKEPDWVKEKIRINSEKIEEVEIIGKLGVDFIEDGLLPDGTPYEWKKRRP